MATTGISVPSPKGGIARVNPRNGRIFRYEPSAAYRRFLSKRERISSEKRTVPITREMLYNQKKFAEQCLYRLSSKLIDAYVRPNKINYQEGVLRGIITEPKWIHNKKYSSLKPTSEQSTEHSTWTCGTNARTTVRIRFVERRSTNLVCSCSITS